MRIPTSNYSSILWRDGKWLYEIDLFKLLSYSRIGGECRIKILTSNDTSILLRWQMVVWDRFCLSSYHCRLICREIAWEFSPQTPALYCIDRQLGRTNVRSQCHRSWVILSGSLWNTSLGPLCFGDRRKVHDTLWVDSGPPFWICEWPIEIGQSAAWLWCCLRTSTFVM